jgi:hypothetical protein
MSNGIDLPRYRSAADSIEDGFHPQWLPSVTAPTNYGFDQARLRFRTPSIRYGTVINSRLEVSDGYNTTHSAEHVKKKKQETQKSAIGNRNLGDLSMCKV